MNWVQLPALEKAPSNFLYIGRNMNMGGWKLPKSKWHNPRTVKDFPTREGLLAWYKNYVLTNPTLLNSLNELTGKVLLCWCMGEPCHGDVLRELYLAQWNESNYWEKRNNNQKNQWIVPRFGTTRKEETYIQVFQCN